MRKSVSGPPFGHMDASSLDQVVILCMDLSETFIAPFKLSDARMSCSDGVIISWLYLSGHLFYTEHFQEPLDISPLYLRILCMY